MKVVLDVGLARAELREAGAQSVHELVRLLQDLVHGVAIAAPLGVVRDEVCLAHGTAEEARPVLHVC
jgi:hypothetical protein